MRRVITAAITALCALLLVAGPAAAQYPPQQPPDNTGVLPGGEVDVDVDVDDDDDIGDREAVPAARGAGENTAVAGVSETRGGTLAYSGFQMATGVVLALMALVIGTGLLVVTRRRGRQRLGAEG